MFINNSLRTKLLSTIVWLSALPTVTSLHTFIKVGKRNFSFLFSLIPENELKKETIKDGDAGNNIDVWDDESFGCREDVPTMVGQY